MSSSQWEAANDAFHTSRKPFQSQAANDSMSQYVFNKKKTPWKRHASTVFIPSLYRIIKLIPS